MIDKIDDKYIPTNIHMKFIYIYINGILKVLIV